MNSSPFETPATYDTDVIIIGSGFGGSVAALRLAEKGYAVRVIEAGRRFADHDFARTSWDVRRYLWAPKLGCYGVQRIHRLRDVMILAGAGVGGGSLNYANTLYEPPQAFYDDQQWAHITDWRAELAPVRTLAEHAFDGMLVSGLCIARAALERRGSRGGHYREDYPVRGGYGNRHVNIRRGSGGLPAASWSE